MKSIYKYEIPVSDLTHVALPVGYEILSVGTQNDRIFLWALVNPEEPNLAHVALRIAGTGHSVDPDTIGEFLGTVHLHGGALVFHVFRSR